MQFMSTDPHTLFAFMAHTGELVVLRGIGRRVQTFLWIRCMITRKELIDTLSRIGSKIARMEPGADRM